ncbi:MAG: MFS transporter [Phycisphaeraceae bacterium]|nr:MAG: MFS transporter [Phycisphaeraceae bacterium]
MAREWLESIVDMRRGELIPSLMAAAMFFCLLCGYFLLRPLRDALGLEGGVDSLHGLFLATVGVMIVGNVAYGFVAARVPRTVLVPAVYLFALASLAVFLVYVVPGGKASATVGRVFYVWLSVFNLFAVSVFWSLLADVFTLEQGKRLFGFIGAGGTGGAITGSFFAWTWVKTIGPAGLMGVAAGLIALTAVLALLLSRRATRTGRPGAAVGGASWAGLTRLFSSPYLAGIGTMVLLFTITSTLLYFEKARIISLAVEGQDERASLFAGIEFAAQTLTILLQIFLTGRLMRWLGVGVMLAVVPLISIGGFTALGLVPTLTVVTIFEVTRRASNFALTKPARETLFTVVPRQDKYKAKAAIDTFVYRGGDTVGALADQGIAAMGWVIAAVAVPVGVVGVALAWWLGRAERRMDRETKVELESETPDQERDRHAAIAS